MASANSDSPNRRRIRNWLGSACGVAMGDDRRKHPVYMNSAGAYSVQAVQNTSSAPPGPYSHSHIAATSMAQLPHRAAPAPVHVQYSGPAPGSPLPSSQPSKPKTTTSSDLLKLKSCTHLSQSVSSLVSHTTGKANATILELENLVLQSFNGGQNVRSATSQLLDRVITVIDIGSFCGRENELVSACALPSRLEDRKNSRPGERRRPAVPVDYFSKVYLYANSRMPPNLPPLKFYPATYPLLRLAAQYSRRVYDKPHGRERQSYVDSDWRQGTKAMVIKSLPIDDMNTIVFAIRGTQTFMDWAVNVKTAPIAPSGFLHDPSNLCHAGFLSVARKMIAPVAARLRTLIEEDPNRMSYNLMITGHSAGGAVASLLYLHLVSESSKVTSELTHLRGCFKHIHCITFGAPPISIRPLAPPSPKRSKSVFFALINEGDPVARADKGYFFSLLDLYVSAAPGSNCSVLGSRSKSRSDTYWRVPPSTLSNAGRLVLLRTRGIGHSRSAVMQPPVSGRTAPPPREEVEACGTTDAELRGLVFGDPFMHSMDLYARRIEALR